MKRKKWREEEEQTLLHCYYSSSLNSSSNHHLVPMTSSRQKRFQPIADHVNSVHHVLDPSAYRFLWSWRDIAIKIHNMRHQYLNVKKKLAAHTQQSGHNWDGEEYDELALSLWPNFLLYKQVFGDIDASAAVDDDDDGGDDAAVDDDDGGGGDDDDDYVARKLMKKRRWREERRRREESREEEEMEWMERVVATQMEHVRQAMQMHADACQAQLQVLGILVRVVCQLLGPGSGAVGGGDGVGNGPEMSNLQQRARREEEETDRENVGGGG